MFIKLVICYLSPASAGAFTRLKLRRMGLSVWLICRGDSCLVCFVVPGIACNSDYLFVP
jgi:hypothetical protein